MADDADSDIVIPWTALASSQSKICKVCNKDFAVERNLKGHRTEIHLTKENFTCEGCLKYFSCKRSLVSHISICKGSKVPNYDKK